MTRQSLAGNVRAWIAALTVLGLAALAAACDSNDTIPTPTPNSSDLPPVEACSLIPAEDLEAVIGPADEGASTQGAPFFQCKWTSDDFNYNVNLDVYHDLRDNVVAYYDQSGEADSVSGLGEQAKWSSALQSLEVLQGNYDLRLEVISSYRDFDSQSAAKELAAVTLENLPD